MHGRTYTKRARVEYDAAAHDAAVAELTIVNSKLRKLAGVRRTQAKAWRNVYQNVTMRKRRGLYAGDVLAHPDVIEARTVWLQRKKQIDAAHGVLLRQRRQVLDRIRTYTDALTRVGSPIPSRHR